MHILSGIALGTIFSLSTESLAKGELGRRGSFEKVDCCESGSNILGANLTDGLGGLGDGLKDVLKSGLEDDS